MAAGTIRVPPDSTGSYVQTFVNSISALNQHAQCITLVTSTGASIDCPSGNALAFGGNIDHDGVDAGSPIKIGMKAATSDPTAVANADRANALGDKIGRLVVMPYCLPENLLDGKTAAITDTTSTAVIAAQGAGVKIYLTSIQITNSHATVGTLVTVLDGATEKLRVYVPALNGTAGESTVVLEFPVPIALTANTALNVQCVTTGANVYASAQGYKGA